MSCISSHLLLLFLTATVMAVAVRADVQQQLPVPEGNIVAFQPLVPIASADDDGDDDDFDLDDDPSALIRPKRQQILGAILHGLSHELLGYGHHHHHHHGYGHRYPGEITSFGITNNVLSHITFSTLYSQVITEVTVTEAMVATVATVTGIAITETVTTDRIFACYLTNTADDDDDDDNTFSLCNNSVSHCYFWRELLRNPNGKSAGR